MAKKENLITKEGFPFKFDSSKCEECQGGCCRGGPGYVWVDADEVEQIARWTGLNPKEFIRKINGKISLKEIKSGNEYLCFFLEPTTGKCQIYPVRPFQCQQFPFWERFKIYIEEVVTECPGIVIE